MALVKDAENKILTKAVAGRVYKFERVAQDQTAAIRKDYPNVVLYQSVGGAKKCFVGVVGGVMGPLCDDMACAAKRAFMLTENRKRAAAQQAEREKDRPQNMRELRMAMYEEMVRRGTLSK